MKILIVDDEQTSRKMIRGFVSRFAVCEEAEDGQEAVNAFINAWENWSPFDIMTLDVEMPEVGGQEALQQIRGLEKSKNVPGDKQVKVLMVTMHQDKETIVSCIESGCNDYITKPLDKTVILQKITKLGFHVPVATKSSSPAKKPAEANNAPIKEPEPPKTEELSEEKQKTKEMIRKTITAIVHKFKEGDIELPVLPKVFQDIQKVMNDGNSNVEDLARVIEKDAVMSVKLIFTANSPFYRGTENIKTVSKAIARLGFKETQGIVSAIANKSLYNTKNDNMNMLMEELWLHSLACAYGSREIGKAIGFEEPESLFLMGLVHDIGKVLLLKTFGDRSADGDMSELTEVAAVVQDVHTSFGGALLKRWGFADNFVKIATKHEGQEFESGTDKELLIINLANNLTRKIGYSLLDEEVDLLDLDSAKHLNIEQNTLDKILEEVKKQIQSSGDMFN